MNTPNPLVPQGSFLEKRKSHIKITILATLAIHVVLLGVLLIAGCNKKTSTDQAPEAAGGVTTPTPPPGNWPEAQTSAPPVAIVAPTDLTPTNITPPPLTPPLHVAPDSTSVVAALTEHTIVKGESFYTLGKKYNVGFKAIADANPGVNPNRLKIGDKIKIPPPKTGRQTAALTGVSGAGEGVAKTYKVRSGDNLMKIAKSHGVNVKLLRSANNLKTDQIKVGQTLKIPAKPAPAAAESIIPSVPSVDPGSQSQVPPAIP